VQLHALIGEDFADEQPAVALPRLALAAQQRDSTFATSRQQALYGSSKRGLLGYAVVARVTLLVVVLLPRRPPAKLLSQKEISHSYPTESDIQQLAVELRRNARVGIGADVHDELDPLTPQELREALKRVIRMTDGPDDRHSPHKFRVSRLTDMASDSQPRESRRPRARSHR